MTTHREQAQGRGRRRADGRRQLLVYLPPEVIKDVKKAAVDDDTTASSIAAEALLAWLKRREAKTAKPVPRRAKAAAEGVPGGDE